MTKEKIEEYLKQGLTQREIAKKLGISRSTIWYQLNKTEKKPSIKQQSIELYNQGLSIIKIAKKLDRSVSSISQHLIGIEKRKRAVKVTTKQIEEEILKCSSSNEVCNNLGISSRLYYKHIKGNRFTGKNKTLHNKIKELHSKGLTNVNIANELNLSTCYINQLIRKNGLKPNKIYRFDVEKLKELFYNNHKFNYIALEIGITPTTCGKVIKELGLTRVKIKPIKVKKSKATKRKLKIKQINELINEGWTARKLVNHGVCALKTSYKYMRKLNKSIPAEISRDMLGKGFERGEVKAVKLREDRDSGRLVKFKYSDLSDYPTVLTEIRVKDEVSDQEAIERWGKKHNKKSWKLV